MRVEVGKANRPWDGLLAFSTAATIRKLYLRIKQRHLGKAGAALLWAWILTVELIHCIQPALAAFVEGLCGPKVAAVHAFLHTVGQARVAIVRPRT